MLSAKPCFNSPQQLPRQRYHLPRFLFLYGTGPSIATDVPLLAKHVQSDQHRTLEADGVSEGLQHAEVIAVTRTAIATGSQGCGCHEQRCVVRDAQAPVRTQVCSAIVQIAARPRQQISYRLWRHFLLAEPSLIRPVV